MGFSGLERQAQGLGVHIGEHQDRAVARRLGDAEDEAVGDDGTGSAAGRVETAGASSVVRG